MLCCQVLTAAANLAGRRIDWAAQAEQPPLVPDGVAYLPARPNHLSSGPDGIRHSVLVPVSRVPKAFANTQPKNAHAIVIDLRAKLLPLQNRC